MKLKNYFAFVLLGGMLLSSCNKDEDIKGDKGNVSTGKTEIFTASIGTEVGSFELLEYGADENDARASVTSKGYAVPSLDITKVELENGDYTAHWGVLGDNKTPDEESVLQTYILASLPSIIPSVSSLFVKENAGSKNDLNFYCPVSSELAPYTNKWAYFAFGGKRNGQYLEFNTTSNTSPNARIVGMKNMEEQTARQIPLMTEVQPFDNLLAPMSNPLAHAPKTKFKPRGCLISLCFVNKFSTPITITDIVVAKDNALYFEGRFDMQNSKDGMTNFKSDTQSGNKEAKFEGEGENQSFTFPVYADNATTTKGYTLPRVVGTFASKKADLPLFHLWGMPRTIGCWDRLKLQVKFKKNGQDCVTRIFRITLPNNRAFVEGKAYRLPIRLNDNSLFRLVGNGHNPLDYVAEYDLNRGTKPLGNEGVPFVTIGSKNYPLSHMMPHPTGFRTSHDYSPTITDVTTPGQPENTVGYFNWYEAYVLFNHNKPAWLNDYVLPTKGQWLSILPSYATHIRFDVFQAQTLADESGAVIGAYTVPDGTKSDFITKLACPSFATYALRFKGTPHESAWRYSLERVAGQYKMTIECVGGLQHSGLTLADISSSEFFSSNPATTTRFFSGYGVRRHNSPNLYFTHNLGAYWSSTFDLRPFLPPSAWFARYYRNMAGVTSLLVCEVGMAIRPFKKTP